WATAITREHYFEKPELEMPGFFKETPCSSPLQLPQPLESSGVDVLEAVRRRRSRRSFSEKPLSLAELSTLLYYSVGVTGYDERRGRPLRTYPSAGGRQPLEVYVSASRVEGLEPGIYHYRPRSHELCMLRRSDHARRLASACLDQDHVAEAPASLIMTVVYARTASR
ncbi:MAG: SagB/ThcOx family dehydrogenase, partial [Thermoproteota archaeon]